MHILATASLSKKVLGQKGPFVKKEFNLKSCLTFYIKAELILFSRIFAESNSTPVYESLLLKHLFIFVKIWLWIFILADLVNISGLHVKPMIITRALAPMSWRRRKLCLFFIHLQCLGSSQLVDHLVNEINHGPC